MKNTKTFSLPASKQSSYQNQLFTLETKIGEINKQISYLDVYNIVAVCENKDTFAAQVNALTANSSLVINTEGFYWNEERYETGDIILKIADGTPIHIRAQTGGIYYPSKVKENSTGLDLTYTFSPIKPTKINATVTEDKTTSVVTELGKEISFELTQKAPSNIYGLWKEYGDGTFKAEYIEAKNEDGTVAKNEDGSVKKILIQPYIKFYLQDNEEIICDYSWKVTGTESNKQIEVNVGDMKTSYLDKDSNTTIHTVYMKVK